jgi:hypothetical protein
MIEVSLCVQDFIFSCSTKLSLVLVFKWCAAFTVPGTVRSFTEPRSTFGRLGVKGRSGLRSAISFSGIDDAGGGLEQHPGTERRPINFHLVKPLSNQFGYVKDFFRNQNI